MRKIFRSYARARESTTPARADRTPRKPTHKLQYKQNVTVTGYKNRVQKQVTGITAQVTRTHKTTRARTRKAIGEEASFYADGGKLYVHSTGMGADVEYSPLGNTVYDRLSITDLTFTKGAKSDMIDVHIEISDGSRVQFTSDVSVSVLNI